MPRGERIGDAYVKIHADGTGIDKDIRDDFDDLGDTLEKYGKKHAKAYEEAYREETGRQRKVTNREIIAGFDRSLASMAARVDRVTQPLEKSIRKRFREIFSDPALAEIATTNLLRDIADGFRDIGSGDLFGDIEAQMRRANKDWEKTLDAALRLNQEFDKDVAESRDRQFDLQHRLLAEAAQDWEETLDAAYRLNQEFDRKVSADRDKMFDLEVRAAAERQRLAQQVLDFQVRMQKQRVAEDKKTLQQVIALEESYIRLVTGNTRLEDSFKRTRDRARELNEALKYVEANSDEAEETLRRMRLGLIRLNPRLNAATRAWDQFGDRVGRATGRGSRNNFLNFVGSVNRNVTRLTGTLTLGFAKAITSGLSFFKMLATGGLSFKDFKTLAGSAIKALAGGVTTLAAFAAAMTVVILSASVLTTILSGLAAIVTSLAASIGFALVGAIGAAAGALVPLVVGIGVVTAAFKSLDDAQKKALKRDLKPLANSFKALGDAAAEVLFRDVGEWARDLAPAIDRLRPSVVGVARAIRNVLGGAINDLTTGKSGKAFDGFIDKMNIFLPKATRKLGNVFTNTFAGLSGVFYAMLPLVNRFLNWLGEITEEFAAWANSKSGRRELRQFFKDAGDSAAAFGEFLKQAGKFLGELLQQARDEGDQIFLDMAEAIEDMVDWLSSKEGQDAIEDWLEFGREFGKALGEMVIAAGKLFDALDSPGARKFVVGLANALSDVLGFFAKYPEALAVLGGPLGLTILAITKLIGWIQDLIGWFQNLNGTDLGGLVGAVRLLGDALAVIANLVGGGLSDLPGILRGIVAALPGGGALIGGIDALTGALDALGIGGEASGGKLEGAFQPIPGLTSAVAEGILAMRDSLDQVTGAATAATRALALQNLQESGLLKVGRELGISARSLTGAFSGNANAARSVVDQFLAMKNPTIEQRLAFNDLIRSLGLHVTNLRNERREIQLNTAVTRNYSGLLKGLPQQVKTVVRADGVRPSARGIASVIDKAKELGGPNMSGRQIRTLITASGEQPTRKMVERIRAILRRLANQRTEPTIDPNIKPFDAREKHVRDQLNALDRRPPTKPKVDADDKAFLAREKKVRQMLEALDSRPPAKPKVELDDDQAYAQRAALVASMSSIGPFHYDIIGHFRTEGSPGGGGGGGGGGSTGPTSAPGPTNGRVIAPTITVVSNSDDPAAVAQETLNRIVALGY